MTAGIEARPYALPLYLTAGADLDITITVQHPDGSPATLTAGVYVLEVRPAPGAATLAALELTAAGNILTGTIDGTLASLLALAERRHVHNVTGPGPTTLAAGTVVTVPDGLAGIGAQGDPAATILAGRTAATL